MASKIPNMDDVAKIATNDTKPSMYNCRFLDGSASRPKYVTVTLEDGIHIYALDDQGKERELLAKWKMDEVRSHEGPSHILILSNSTNQNYERLEIHNKEAIKTVKKLAPNMAKTIKAERAKSHKIAALSIGALISAVVLIIWAIPLLTDRLVPLIPLSTEARVGKTVEDQVAQVFLVNSLEEATCHSKEGDLALQKMLKLVSKDADLPFEIDLRIVKSDIPNAFALPGGKVMFLSKIIDMADDPDQIAGVLAHELGHVKHRDSMRLILQATGRSFFISMLLGDFTGSTALIFAAQTTLNSSFSREVETEADIFAIEQLKKAKVGTKPLGVLLTRISDQHLELAKGENTDDSGADPHENKEDEHKAHKEKTALWDSHPLTKDRMAMLERAETNQNTVPSLSQKEWQALKNICKGL